MKRWLSMALLLSSIAAQAQFEETSKDTSWKTIYRASATKINDLVHTKLDVKFDFGKSYLYGREWVTLRPHFYSTDSLTLDAKGMNINQVAVVSGPSRTPLKYAYDSLQLRIKLNKTYTKKDTYTIYIDYTAKPDEAKQEGSAAITEAKGLYFINPRGEEKDKPTQVWTQGETESNSVWFPTIDKPNQKCTDEISMTVPAKYVTLSNGLKVSEKKNADGTRTDTWKMDLPHSPYLFFMGVGDYSIIKDSHNGKEVSYYVEKEYAPVARKIFGETPRMIATYEKLTGVPFPWAKYSQIVGRDYVSGAMENTTATLHQESAYQNARQLTDGNRWEEVIAHELFHQWFGDLVTTESWSNITVNESFADYGETLWNEARYGKDAGDEHIEENRHSYLANPANAKKNLVRFYYNSREDVFDQVSYPKGGSILHMLRTYVGDSAFFASLHKYLVDNKFKNGEAHQLRLAFEEVTGQDLNWFWNEWYYGSGHPKLNISYAYASGRSSVIVEQTGDKLFTLPVAIDIYNGANKTRQKVWISNKIDTFTFTTPSKPDLINVDAEKGLLVVKNDHKTAENFVYQWKYAPTYLDRKEALDYFAENKMKELLQGLNDKYYGLRQLTLEKLAANTSLVTPDALNTIEKIASTDDHRTVRAKAIEILGKQKDQKYMQLFIKNTADSSYSVAGAALEALIALDPAAGNALAKKLSGDAKGKLGKVVTSSIMANATEADFDVIYKQYKDAPPSEDKLTQTSTFAKYLATIKDNNKIKTGVAEIMKFRSMIPEQYRQFTDNFFKTALGRISKAKKEQGDTQMTEYLDSLIK